MAWTKEATSTIIDKPGAQSIVPAMVANGWLAVLSASASGGTSTTLTRDYVNFGEVLTELYAKFNSNWSDGAKSTDDIMEEIVGLEAVLKDVSASITKGTAVTASPTACSMGTVGGGTAAAATPTITTISDGWFPEVDAEKYDIVITPVASPATDITNALTVAKTAIDLARTTFTTKIKEAAGLVDKRLDKYKYEMQKVGTDYNPKIQTVLDKFINDFKAYQDTVSDELDDWGVSEKAVIDLAFTTERSKRQAEMIDKHTYNSLTWAPISAGITREHQMALTNLSDKLVERRINLEKDLYISQEKARADLISGLESMRSNDLQEISTIIPHIMKEVDVLSQAYTNYLNTVGSQEIQTAGMTIDSLLKIYDVDTRMAQFEADLGLKNGELTLKVDEIRANIAANKASAFTSENSSARSFASSIASSKNSLTASKYGNESSRSIADASNKTNVSVAKARAEVDVSIANAQMETSVNTQEANLEAQDVMAQNSIQAQLTNALVSAYSHQMSNLPKLSDLAAILGAATSIEGVE